jgi:hypothetical protein
MHKFYLALAVLATLTATGCSSLGLGGSSTDSTATDSSTAATGTPKVSDSEIVTAIKDSFKQDPEIAGAGLSISSNNGVVTLSGNLPNAQTYNRAISLARNVPGVRPPVRAADLKFR